MEDLFVQLTRRAEGKKPRLNPREWSEVLQDVFELRRFIPVVSVHLCLGTIHKLHIQYSIVFGFHLPILYISSLPTKYVVLKWLRHI